MYVCIHEDVILSHAGICTSLFALYTTRLTSSCILFRKKTPSHSLLCVFLCNPCRIFTGVCRIARYPKVAMTTRYTLGCCDNQVIVHCASRYAVPACLTT